MGFCSRCGHEVREAESYCSACGLALSPATVASTPPQWPEPADGSAGVRGRAGTTDAPEADHVVGPGGADDSSRIGGGVPRRRLLIGAGVLVLAMIGAGAWSAVQDRSPGTVFFGSFGSMPLTRAVTSPPHQQWTRDTSDNNGTSIVPEDGVTFIATTDETGSTTTVVAVEDDGEERWSTELDKPAYLAASSPDHDVVVLVPWTREDKVGTFQALSTDDGSLVWESDAGDPVRVTDGGLLIYSDSRVLLIDLADGTGRWDLPRGDAVASNSDLLLVADDGTLTAFDLGSGEQRWTVDEDVPCPGAGRTGCSIAAADRVILVVGDNEAVAYDPADGSRLWTDTVGERGSQGVLSADLVYLGQQSSNVDETSDWSVVTYGREGKQSEMALDGDDGYAPFGITTGGRSYLANWSASHIYDDQLDLVAHYDSDVTLTSGGVYALERDELSYHRFDRSDPVWTLQVPPDAQSATPGDHAIVLAWADKIALYR